MSQFTRTLRNYAELGRISNLPTTITNVLTGAAIGASGLLNQSPSPLDWMTVSLTWLAIACFYTGGMAMNDWIDAPVDLVERPNRPVPSGRIRRSQAAIFFTVLIAIGLTILAMTNLLTVAMGAILVAAIVCYNLLHGVFAGSVVLMGVARGMVYVVAAAATLPPVASPPDAIGRFVALDWRLVELFAAVLAGYTILFSILARSETLRQFGISRWLTIFIPIIAASPAIVIRPPNWMWMIVVFALTMAWLTRGVSMAFADPPRVQRAVLTWIAGICLIDALFLALLDWPIMSMVAIGCFIVTILAQRRIAGT